MWSAVEADVMRGTDVEGQAGQRQRRTAHGVGGRTGHRGPQPAGTPQTKVA
jgi:hypothetical protein